MAQSLRESRRGSKPLGALRLVVVPPRHRGPAGAEGEVSCGVSRQAPRFHAYFSHLEGHHVLLMSRPDWEQLGRMIRPGELVEIELSPTPIAAVVQDSRVVAAVAERQSDSEVAIEVYRDDPRDAPTPVNRDRYRLWERLPSHRDYQAIVNSASTEDNANMRGFLDDHVFLVKDEMIVEHWLRELPARVRAVLRRP